MRSSDDVIAFEGKTYQEVLRRTSEYFGIKMQSVGTRFNWYVQPRARVHVRLRVRVHVRVRLRLRARVRVRVRVQARVHV